MALAPQIENLFGAEWRRVTAAAPAPTRLRDVRVADFATFRGGVYSGDPGFVSRLVTSVYAGDAYVLRDAFPADALRNLKKEVFRFRRSRPQSPQLIIDACEDFHCRAHTESGAIDGYGSAYHVYNFFRWNDDPHGVFKLAAESYRLMKTIAGFAPDKFEANRPSDGTVDKLEILHYPRGVGGIDIHSDPINNVKFTMCVNLTEPGVDYAEGGFVMADANGVCRMVEDMAPLGSIVSFFPSMYHGVQVIDPAEPEDWDSLKGRWFMGISSVHSHMVEGRDKTVPAHGFATVQEQKHAAFANAR